MTHALGTGTVNLSLNLPRDERLELGRAAFKSGARSVGEFTKRLILRGLEAENLESAMRVREIRQRYYGAALLAIIILTIVAGEDQTMRRARGNRARVRSVRVEEVYES